MTDQELTSTIIGCAIEVHRILGPGLLESAYETCRCHELSSAGLRVRAQQALPVVYKDVKLEAGYRMDLLVEGRVVVELKAVEALAPIHDAIVLTYLRLPGCRIGLLINFNVPVLTQGIHRLVLKYDDAAGKALTAETQRTQRNPNA